MVTCSSEKNMQKTMQRGFSLLEMVAVIALMAIFILLIGPNIKNALLGGKKKRGLKPHCVRLKWP